MQATLQRPNRYSIETDNPSITEFATFVSMHCKHIRPKLSAFHDHELGRSEAEAVRAHLMQCQGCRDLASDFRSIARALDPGVTPPGPAADFTDRVFARIHDDARESVVSRDAREARTVRWIAAAAALIIGLGAIYLAAPRTNSSTLDAASEKEVEKRLSEMRAFNGPPLAEKFPQAPGVRPLLGVTEGDQAGSRASLSGTR